MMWLVELVSSHTIVGCRKQNGPHSDRKMRVISDQWDPPQPFAVSKYKLTFAEWDACAAQGGCNAYVLDSGFGRGRQPVINVGWDEAKEYVAWLSSITRAERLHGRRRHRTPVWS